MTSEKSKTNKKWTSSEEYRDNFERIFGKKNEEAPKLEDPIKCRKCGEEDDITKRDGDTLVFECNRCHFEWRPL